MDQPSDSGFIEKPLDNVCSMDFVDYEEMPCAGFNRIFRAKRYGKYFVLKGLKPEYASNPFYKQLLDKEFVLGIMLDHPNIVTFYGREFDPIAGDCIVMEYVDGMTLTDFLETKPKHAVAKKIVTEILSAMAYFHALQIVHRDIKPSNILITRNGNNVKIIDFGFSDTDSHVVLKQPAGTAKYAAPEQYDENVALDCRADIYSFGMVLKDIVSSANLLGYGRIISKCTRKDRSRRYDNAMSVASAISMRRKLKFALLVLFVAFALVATNIYFIVRNNANNVQISEEHLVDTVLYSRVDTVIWKHNGENLLKKSEVQVIVKENDTTLIHELRQEAIVEFGKIFNSFFEKVKRTNEYSEFACWEWQGVVEQAYGKRDEIAARVSKQSVAYSQVYNMLQYELGQIMGEFSKLKLPSFCEEYQAGVISVEEYDSLSSIYDSLAKEYSKNK